MRLDNATISFEIGDKVVELDVLNAQLAIEKAQEASKGEPSIVLTAVKKLFSDASGVVLTDTQAWCAISGVEAAYEQVKKKLSRTLESAFGTALTLSENQNVSSDGSTDSSPTDLPNESCTIDSQEQSCQPTGSES